MTYRQALRSLGLLVMVVPCFCAAEILHGIFPLDDLKAIKQKYPNGQFTRVNAAWVTEDEAFFNMSGQGFVGQLFLDFSDGRPDAKKYIAENCVATSGALDPAVESLCTLEKSIASQTDDDALSIKWVRWVPPLPIPLERYRSKYGEPTTIEFDSDTMMPHAYWEKVDLRAQLSDDKKYVLHVTTAFTRSELRQAWQRKYHFIPADLKDAPAGPPAREKPKAPARKAQ